MSDGFWTSFNTYFWPGLFIFLGGLVVQIPTIIVAIRTNRKINDVKVTALATKNELVAQVSEVRDHMTTQALKKKDIDLMVAGAERQGYVGGIEVGKAQATGPGGVTDFNPLEK